MADHDNVQDPGAELADEGIPPLEGHLRGKIAAGDTHDGVVPPGDEPIAADEFGTTAAEERRGEPFADRVAREEPDVEHPQRHAGRLVEPGGGETADVEKDEIGTTAGYDDGAFSAEEQAVQVREDPPGLT